MLSNNKFFLNYLIILFSLIPFSLIVGSAVLEANFIIIIITFIIYLFLNKKDMVDIKNDPTLIILLIFWFYLICNTILSLDASLSIRRNLLFFKFILLVFSFKFFFLKFNILNKIIYAWSFVILVVVIDVIFEFYIGKNLLGFKSVMPNERVVSFFKDELIVGSFLLAFLFPIVGTLIFNNKKNIGIILGILICISIIMSGERSAFIKLTLSMLLIISTSIFSNRVRLFIITGLLLTALIVSQNVQLRQRHINNVYASYNLDINNLYNSALETKYINQSILTYEILKKNMWFGVGNKNYHKACSLLDNKKLKLKCYTHPHQIYYEFLSEHGIIGTFILLLLFYCLLFKFNNNNDIANQRNKIFIFKLYCVITFVPILPTANFFSSLSLSLFWINYVFYEVYKKRLNILKK